MKQNLLIPRDLMPQSLKDLCDKKAWYRMNFTDSGIEFNSTEEFSQTFTEAVLLLITDLKKLECS